MGYRINSTGRKRLLRECVRVRLFEQGGGRAPTFEANVKLPADLKLPASAKVYVEAYVKSSSMRFDFGTVGQIAPPSGLALTEIDAGAAVLFRVKVVDESAEIGRILASADGIRPESDSDGDERKPLLPLQSRDLGEEIWRLDIDKDAGCTLIVNNRIPDLIELLKSDSRAQSFIYPEVVRRIVLFIYGGDPEFDADAEWAADWKEWIDAQLNRQVSDDEVPGPDEVQTLADDVAAAFSRSNKFVSRWLSLNIAPIESGL